MNTETPLPGPAPADVEASAPAVTAVDTAAPKADVAARPVSRPVVLFLAAVALLAMLLSGLLWQKLNLIEEQLTRQSADSGSNAMEARSMARLAQDQVRETAARQAVMDARLSEVALQRSQLEELMQSLSRSRDENMVVDIDSAVRLAQQQAQLTGSVEPLLAALRSADQRLVRAAQPRLAPLQRAIARDLGRIKSSTVSDTPALLLKMDEVVLLVDDIPLANARLPVAPSAALQPRPDDGLVSWWQRSLQQMADQLRGLVRVSRIEQPEAVLLSPDQSFFLRENLKLRLLNARLGLLSRQFEASRADLAASAVALQKYFDAGSRRAQTAAALLQQMQAQMKTLELPRVDETLAALATAAAGR